jgi:hypothetical protein
MGAGRTIAERMDFFGWTANPETLGPFAAGRDGLQSGIFACVVQIHAVGDACHRLHADEIIGLSRIRCEPPDARREIIPAKNQFDPFFTRLDKKQCMSFRIAFQIGEPIIQCAFSKRQRIGPIHGLENAGWDMAIVGNNRFAGRYTHNPPVARNIGDPEIRVESDGQRHGLPAQIGNGGPYFQSSVFQPVGDLVFMSERPLRH